MTYSTDIDALSPDHRWSFDGDSLDAIATTNGTETGIIAGVAICVDASASRATNGTLDRISLAAAVDVDDETTQKLMSGWFRATAIQQPPVRIYGEGNNTVSFSITMGFGNNVTFEVDNAVEVLQIAGDVPLAPNRAYHLAFGFDQSGSGEIRAYLDGIPQLDSANKTLTAIVPARGVGEFGDPAGTVSLGGTNFILVAPVNGEYNQWASWSGAASLLTDNQVRQELFEKGAIPDVVITDQAGLDALASTVRGNSPNCIQVDIVGDISLTADNVTFDALASIHVQYTGTGILTWTNTNGADASIGSATGGGSIAFVNPATLTVIGLVVGGEFRIYDDELSNSNNLDTELDGVESLVANSFNYAHGGATNDVVVQLMASGIEELTQTITLGASDQTVQLFPKVETNA